MAGQDDRSTGFKVVHIVLAVVSIGFGAAIAVIAGGLARDGAASKQKEPPGVAPPSHSDTRRLRFVTAVYNTSETHPSSRKAGRMGANTGAYERRWWILGVLCLSLLVIVLDNSILNVALPDARARELRAGRRNSQLQWMVDAYTLVFAGLLLTAGSLGDRFGRRGRAQVGHGRCSASARSRRRIVDSPSQLIATRALMGVGGAFIMPATLSIITNVFPAEERGRGDRHLGRRRRPRPSRSARHGRLPARALLLGLDLPGERADRRRRPHRRRAHHADVQGPDARRGSTSSAPLLSIVGLVSLVYAFIEAPTKGWSDSTILGRARSGGSPAGDLLRYGSATARIPCST